MENGSAGERQGIPVGGNHRRAISCTLAVFDETLCRFSRWAGGAADEGPLYREMNDLSEEQRADVLAEIAAARAILRRLHNDLQLQPEIQSVAKSVWGQCAWIWESLVELQAAHLKRYGAPPAALAAYLDPQIDRLIERLGAISAIVRQAKDSEKCP